MQFFKNSLFSGTIILKHTFGKKPNKLVSSELLRKLQFQDESRVMTIIMHFESPEAQTIYILWYSKLVPIHKQIEMSYHTTKTKKEEQIMLYAPTYIIPQNECNFNQKNIPNSNL